MYKPFKVKNKQNGHLNASYPQNIHKSSTTQHKRNKNKKVKTPKPNFPNGEQEAMKHPTKGRGVIITTEDKGSAVVVLDTENYIKEANSQLFDKIIYKTLYTDRALQHDKLVNDTPDQFKNKKILSKTITEELKVINPKTSKFYITPKIHKKLSRMTYHQLNQLSHLKSFTLC